eukprot:9980586-Ditylum_brightwellii.AAC.1
MQRKSVVGRRYINEDAQKSGTYNFERQMQHYFNEWFLEEISILNSVVMLVEMEDEIGSGGGFITV